MKMPATVHPLRYAFPAVLAQVPLACALWASDVGRAYLNQHPVQFIVFCLLYEAVVGVSIPVWRTLEEDAIKALAAGLRGIVGGVWAGLLNLLVPFRRHYLKQVVYQHRIFNVRGLRTLGTFTLKLEQVFVDLRIAPNSVQGANLDLLTSRELEGTRPIWDFLRRNVHEDGQALAIIGAPGCGKTTLLQHMALSVAAAGRGPYGLPVYVPVMLFLRDHVADITSEKPPTLGKLAEHYFARMAEYPNPPLNWFERQLRHGRCLVLLDGLDEVADAEKRARVSEWAEQQIVTYAQSRFVVTSRPQGYLTAPLQRAHVLEVQPFSAAQVRTFVRNWYLANETVSFGEQDEGIRQDAARKASDLLDRLRQRPSLGDLTRNPLLLTMIAMVHRYRGALPGRRVELYSEICDVLLGRWQEAKGLHSNLTPAQARAIIEPLAADMMQQRCRDMSTAAVLHVIDEPLRQVGQPVEQTIRFLRALQESSGLLLEREPGLWSFAHLTFQEYMTATYWREQAMAQDWPALIPDSWWHETLRLYAAQGDASAMVHACLAADTVPSLTLASECLEEARSIRPEVRALAEQRLYTALEATEPSRRRVAAEVRLTRRLRSLQRMDEGREIDMTYISHAEYQLFLDDQRAAGQLRQPDHWTDYTFPAGQAMKPVVGVHPADAESFCEWLSRQGGGAFDYRLPTIAEVTEYSTSSDATVAAWCHDGPSRWRLAGMERTRAQDLLHTVGALSSLPSASFDLGLGSMDTASVGPDPERDFDLVLAYAVALALNPSCDLVLSCTRAKSLLRTVALSLSRAFEAARVLLEKRRSNPALAPASALSGLLARSGLGDGQLDLDRALVRAAKRARDTEQVNATRLETALVEVRDRDIERDHALGDARPDADARVQGFRLNLDLAFGSQFGANVIRGRDNIRKFAFSLDQGDIDAAYREIQAFQCDPVCPFFRLGALLRDLLDQARADTWLSLRRTRRRYLAHLAEYLWASRRIQQSSPSWLFFLRSQPTPVSTTAHQKLLDLHWRLQLAAVRDEGKLLAWEGIRIVRERRLG